MQAQPVPGLDAVARVAEVDLCELAGAALVDALTEEQRMGASVGVHVDELDVQEERRRVAGHVEPGDDPPGEGERFARRGSRERHHVGPRLDGALVGILVEQRERVHERRRHRIRGIVRPFDPGVPARTRLQRSALGARTCLLGSRKVETQLTGVGRRPTRRLLPADPWEVPANARYVGRIAATAQEGVEEVERWADVARQHALEASSWLS